MHLRLGAAVVAALAPLVLLPASPAFAIANIRDAQQGLSDLDARSGKVDPTTAQQQIVSNLGAHVTWNNFGTPQSLIKYGGYLATGLSTDPVVVAKTFITDNKALFRLSDQGVANLQLLNDSPMVGSDGHAVLFRQTFGSLSATQDGLITVGVVGGKVAYVSSSSAGDGSPPGAATLSPAEAWVTAATDVGRSVSILNVLYTKDDRTTGWTGLKVSGFGQYQRARLTAFPTYTEGVRPAYETIVLDTSGAWPIAYKEYVDAQTGKVWFRQNEVEGLSNAPQVRDNASTAPTSTNSTIGCDPTGLNCAYAGTLKVTTTVECGDPEGPYNAPTGTKSIDVVANTDVSTNDIVLYLYYLTPTGSAVGSSDVLFSPEAIHYEPAGGVPAGNYYVVVCPFTHEPADYTPPYTYHGTISMNTAAGTGAAQNTPKWKVFEANPPLTYATSDSRVIDCWLTSLSSLTPADQECQRAVANSASRAPWDFDVQANAPTFTTRGNNANSAEAWGSPLTPGGAEQRPSQPDRRYVYPWANAWYTSTCDPAQLTPGGNDILSAVTNLFVGHNRMHDFSYNLGFTETNFNAQQNNFGNTAPGPYPAGREFDPEIGNVQAGAVSGGAPSYLGRDNANQITLNDGISPITNQYLFQPIAGAFYAPCVDGDLDTSVFAHEYTHLISNRMVAGPDSGLSGYQAGSMGESWSDLDAVEYLNENGYVPTNGENPFAVGAYVTGNPTVGIRDYAINDDPLNYSDLGFDTAGPEVHADGEIWNGTNYSIRQALVNKYNSTYPAGDSTRQQACAAGKYAADACPGNRRWTQIVYDAWLLMPSGVSMLDARDAYLAADQMRFGGANQTELWRAFAQRGMGSGASTTGTADSQPTPSFESPAESNATITFDATALEAGDAHVNAKVYVGNYEARVTPIADTSQKKTSTAKFVPGTYDFVVQAPGYGLTRFTKAFTAGQTATVTFQLQKNWASVTNGASITGDGSSLGNLIDDTESTQWLYTNPTANGGVAGKQVTVQLGGGAHDISRVQVSAMLQPGQNRFTALRSFEIWACNSATSDCSQNSGFTKIYTSPAAAFPGTIPRPVSPNLIVRSFDVPKTTATHLRLVVLTNQCTGIPGIQTDSDNDPLNNSGCVTGSAQDDNVRAAELEAFGPATADLSIVKTGPPTGHVGQQMTYTIVVTNNGPAPANGVLVTDTLPKNTGFGSATSTQGTCAPRPHSRAVDCNVGTMASGATVTITIVAKPTQKGTYVNTATVSATSPPDPNTANNTSSVTTNVTP